MTNWLRTKNLSLIMFLTVVSLYSSAQEKCAQVLAPSKIAEQTELVDSDWTPDLNPGLWKKIAFSFGRVPKEVTLNRVNGCEKNPDDLKLWQISSDRSTEVGAWRSFNRNGELIFETRFYGDENSIGPKEVLDSLESHMQALVMSRSFDDFSKMEMIHTHPNTGWDPTASYTTKFFSIQDKKNSLQMKTILGFLKKDIAFDFSIIFSTTANATEKISKKTLSFPAGVSLETGHYTLNKDFLVKYQELKRIISNNMAVWNSWLENK